MTDTTRAFMESLVDGVTRVDLGDFLMRLFDTEDLDDAITRFEENESNYWNSWKSSLHCTDNCLYDIIEDCLNNPVEFWRIDSQDCENGVKIYQYFLTLNSYTGDSYDVEFFLAG